ncbi:MAG: hypothetical protein RL186_1164, partial [Pseudomonadota bacterium]
MTSPKSGSPVWLEFCNGPNASVWMHWDCLESFKALLPARDRAKIEATMQDMFC